MKVSTYLCSSISLFALVVSCSQGVGEQADWTQLYPPQTDTSSAVFQLVGPADWRYVDDRLEQVTSGSHRQCIWLDQQLGNRKQDFTMSVLVELLDRRAVDTASWLGYTLGIADPGRKPDSLAAQQPMPGLPIGVTAQGHLFIGKYDEYNRIQLPDRFRLELRSHTGRDKQHYLYLEVFRLDNRMIGQRIVPVDTSWLVGHPALTVSSQLPPLYLPWKPEPDGLVAEDQQPASAGWKAAFDQWRIK